MQIDTNENKERAELFRDEKIFTFIKEILPSGDLRVHNGFVVEVKTDLIIFFDVVSKREIIFKLDKVNLDYSTKKDMTQEMAREIMWEFYKKEGVGK